LLEDARDLILPELLGEGPDRAVAGDLVVLDALRGGDQGGVADLGVAAGVHRLVALGDQPLHRLARLPLGRHTQDAGPARLMTDRGARVRGARDPAEIGHPTRSYPRTAEEDPWPSSSHRPRSRISGPASPRRSPPASSSSPPRTPPTSAGRSSTRTAARSSTA